MPIAQLRWLYNERHLNEAWATYLSHAVHEPEWHLLGALTAYHRKEQYQAKVAVERALCYSPQGEILVRCRFLAGVVAREINDLCMAKEHLEAALHLLDDLPTLRPVMAHQTLFNLALVDEAHGRPERALVRYEAALGEFEQEGLTDCQRMCLQNIAWVCCDLGKFNKAADALESAEYLCESEDAKRTQTMCKGYLLYLRGDHDDALRLCQQVHEDDTAKADIRALTAYIAAEIALTRGEAEAAETLARVAIDQACRPPQDSRCFSRAGRVYAKVKAARLSRSGA